VTIHGARGGNTGAGGIDYVPRVNTRPRRAGLAAVIAALALPASAAAEPERPPTATARTLAAEGGFTPVIARAGGSVGGAAIAATSWDGARGRAALDVAGEVQIYGPIRIVARVDDLTRATARPGAGIGVRLLDETRHGVATTAYLVYKAEGFTAPEGELEATVAFGRRLGPIRAGAALAYGQDLEANDRDAEVAVMALAEPAPGVFAGVTGRYRDSLGSRGEATMVRDLIAGVTATWTVDRFAFTALAGLAGVETLAAPFTTGLATTLSLGAAF